MLAISRPKRRTPPTAAVALVCTTIVALGSACIIAESATDLPQLPPMRPNVVRSSVVPPASAVLGRWPSKFIVPVELVDPREPFEYSWFVDYDPVTGGGFINATTSSFEEGSTTQGRIRTLDIPIADPKDNRCHVVEVIVALRFVSRTDPRLAHTPDEPGGDSVTWFVSPSGDLSGCPLLDAGLIPTDADTGLP